MSFGVLSSAGRISTIPVADHGCLHREQLVRWIDGSKYLNDSFDWNTTIV
jgi:hypothetical protein